MVFLDNNSYFLQGLVFKKIRQWIPIFRASIITAFSRFESCLIDAGVFFNTLIVSLRISISICISSIWALSSLISSADVISFGFTLMLAVVFFVGWKHPFSRYSLIHLYIKEGMYPISSVTNFTGSPLIRQRLITSCFNSVEACLQCFWFGTS